MLNSFFKNSRLTRDIDNIETAVGNQNPQGNLYIEAGLNNVAKYNGVISNTFKDESWLRKKF